MCLKCALITTQVEVSSSDHTNSNAHGVFPDLVYRVYWFNYRVWYLVRAHNSLIRGHFGLGMVWLEVTSVWEWYDKRSLRSGDGMIRGWFKRTLVWSETGFWAEIFSFDLVSVPRDVGFAKRQQKAAFWSQTYLESDGFDQNQRVQLMENAGPLKRKFWLTV